MLRPSRFSTGGSNLTAFDFLSSPLAKLNELLLLGVCSSSDSSPSLESLSNKPGYLSRIDFVGLSSSGRVSVLARPVWPSIVSTTDRLSCVFLFSEIEPSGVLPTRFRGDAVRGGCITLLLLLRFSLPINGRALCGRAVPVVLLLRSSGLEGAGTETVEVTVSERLCSTAALSFRFGSGLCPALRDLLSLA